jgi:hypothetical protein
MDPYLELPAYWSDFHSTFINYWREAIADVLPPDYEAALGERVYLVEHDPEGPREAYIEILHQPERRLVAALELLSPANKEPPGRTEYLAKRHALLSQDVHLIELDLLLSGRRRPLQQPLPPGDYYYLLSRSDRRPDCQVYHWKLRQPLTTLPVPLRAPDADVMIDLGAVFATAYERGRFRRRLPYQGPVPAFVSEKDRAWVESVLPARD